MHSLDSRLALLGWMSIPTRVAAIASTLPVAGAEERGRLLSLLMGLAGRKRGGVALTALVQYSGWLDASQRAELVRVGGERLSGVAGGLADSRDPVARLASVEAIAGLPIIGAAGRLPALLSDPDEIVAEGAERALMVLAARVAQGDSATRADWEGPVFAAALEAVDLIDAHRRKDVLLALAALVHGGVRVALSAESARWIADPEHGAAMAARRMLRRSKDLRVRACAWTWLKHTSLSTACAERLLAPAGAPDHEWMLSRAHLALNPARRSALRKLVRDDGAISGGVVPTGEAFASLTSAARTGFARWVGLLPAPTKIRDAMLAAVLADPDPLVRHAAVRAAADMPGRAACLLDMCFDPDARVAKSACLSVMGQGHEVFVRDPLREHAISALQRSNIPALSAIARGEVKTDWAADANDPATRIQARRVLTTDLSKALRTLTARLAGADLMLAANAAMVAKRLGVVDRLTTVMIEAFERAASIKSDEAERLAATIAGALGGASDADTASVLLRCVGEGPMRVRANAVEALVKRARAGSETLVNAALPERLSALRDEGEHRVRANVARGLMVMNAQPGASGKAGAGERTLVSMLGDPRPMHRAAALWLAERMAGRVARVPGVMESVTEMARAARGDDARAEDFVSDRAERAAKRLVVELRHGWATRAPAMAGASDTAQEAAA